jgi:beta-lactamase superfamily II metal-dependent hydrolase
MSIMPSAAIPEAKATHGELQVHLIDVGHGDAILFDLKDKEFLIDGGAKKISKELVEYLEKYIDDGTLEGMLATHPDFDHTGGLPAILKAFKVEQVYHNADDEGGAKSLNLESWTEFMTAIQEEGAKIHIAKAGDRFSFGELKLEILHPPEGAAGSRHIINIVLSVSYGEVDFLFMGDAGKPVEKAMLDAGIVPNVEILKVGHHGGRDASSAAFLAAAQPETALISIDPNNEYGCPHQETLDHLNQVGAKVYCTCNHGNVSVITDGRSYTVRLEKEEPPLTIAPPPPKSLPTPPPGVELDWSSVPVYNGAKETKKGNWRVPPPPPGEAWLWEEWRFYTTEDGARDVAGYYRIAMKESGFKELDWVQGLFNTVAMAFYAKEGGNEGAMLVIDTYEGKTIIALRRTSKVE